MKNDIKQSLNQNISDYFVVLMRKNSECIQVIWINFLNVKIDVTLMIHFRFQYNYNISDKLHLVSVAVCRFL